MKEYATDQLIALLGATLLLNSCVEPTVPPVIPSQVYSEQIHRQMAEEKAASPSRAPREAMLVSGAFQSSADSRARVRLVSDELPPEAKAEPVIPVAKDGIVTNQVPPPSADPGFTTYESHFKNNREYSGPLALGDPGVSASLWKESKGGNDLFRDDRAWQPMDLVTIVVSENSSGNNEANTEVKQKSTVLASLKNLLGLESGIIDKNSKADGTPKIDLSSLISADTQNDFKGEGKTNRKDSLTARISAMVVEVLPSGILRVEGQKIISVNKEERVMVLSGLVRPKDVTSVNEVNSAQIANMRIDYYGKGIVGEAQQGGWLGRLMRTVWPF